MATPRTTSTSSSPRIDSFVSVILNNNDDVAGDDYTKNTDLRLSTNLVGYEEWTNEDGELRGEIMSGQRILGIHSIKRLLACEGACGSHLETCALLLAFPWRHCEPDLTGF